MKNSFLGKWGCNTVDRLFHGNRKKKEYEYFSFIQTLHILAKTFNSLIIKCSMKGIIQYVSPNVTKVLGYKKEEVLGKRFSIFLHEKDRKILKKYGNSPGIADEDENLTIRIEKKDGFFLWVHLKMHALKDQNK